MSEMSSVLEHNNLEEGITIDFEEKELFLHVKASGKRTHDTARYLTHCVFNAAVEKKYTKVIVDIRELFGESGYFEIILLVKDVMMKLLGKGIDKTAIIDVHRTAIEGWFLEPISHSHGINLRVFASIAEAEEWMKIEK